MPELPMSIPAIPQSEGTIRRIRSDGDIPRQPEPVYLPSNLRGFTAESPNPTPLQQAHLSGGPSSPTSAPPSGPSLGSFPHQPIHSDLGTPQIQIPAAHQPERPVQTHQTSLYVRVMTYFGLGRRASQARKSLVSMIWNMSWGAVQVVVIVVMLILTGIHFKSTEDASISEWKACDRPLGVWASLWVVRVILASGLAYWEFLRDRILHPARPDMEAGQASGPTNTAQGHNLAPMGPPGHVGNGTADNQPSEPPTLPHSALYSRLTLLSSLMTLSWFLTAHILEYTSINSCRHTSPHLWWLVFGILCIMYLMVLEVVLLGFVVLVVAPVLFIFWNIFLICIGRHPMQNPGMIKPEIGKLSKSVVDRIPLVIYIPPPPSDMKPDSDGQSPHLYPPKSPPAIERKPTRTRFRLLTNISSFGRGKPTTAKKVEEAAKSERDSWYDNWEQGEYPFITLEGNRAACAICLMDFEEPKRKNAISNDETEDGKKEKDAATATEGPANRNLPPRSTVASEEERQAALRLSDAGDGAQPLRLLACGHVFHKTCIDPWLTDVSGRCPVCQKPVETSKAPAPRRSPG